MKNLGSLIAKKSFALQNLDEKTVFFVCKKVLIEEYGERGGENITPILFKEKKLFLSPKSSLWRSEAFLHRKRICDRVNELLGAVVVQEVKLAQPQ